MTFSYALCMGGVSPPVLISFGGQYVSNSHVFPPNYFVQIKHYKAFAVIYFTAILTPIMVAEGNPGKNGDTNSEHNVRE